MDTESILLAKYNEHRAQARQHETLRATSTNFIMAIAGGILVFSGGASNEPTSQMVAGGFLAIVGLLGACMSAKHYERFRYHSMLAGEFDRKLRKIAPKSGLADFDTLKANHGEKFPIFSWIRAYFLWTSLLLFISILGVVITFLAGARYCQGTPSIPWLTPYICVRMDFREVSVDEKSHQLRPGRPKPSAFGPTVAVTPKP